MFARVDATFAGIRIQRRRLRARQDHVVNVPGRLVLHVDRLAERSALHRPGDGLDRDRRRAETVMVTNWPILTSSTGSIMRELSTVPGLRSRAACWPTACCLRHQRIIGQTNRPERASR